MVSGYSFLSLAEYFCEATVDGGPLLNTAMMLDSAVTNFSKAVDIGGAVGTAEALAIKNASLVGRARAELFAGNKAAAVTDANAVSAGFTYNLLFINDLTNITRARQLRLAHHVQYLDAIGGARIPESDRSARHHSCADSQQAPANGRRHGHVVDREVSELLRSDSPRVED